MFIDRPYPVRVTIPDQVLLNNAISLSTSGEGRRLREKADASVFEVAAAIGVDPLTLLDWETAQLVPAGPQAADWARMMRVLRYRDKASFAEREHRPLR